VTTAIDSGEASHVESELRVLARQLDEAAFNLRTAAQSSR
jgi:hypothetical protein